MHNHQSNQAIETPFKGLDAAPLLAFFQNDDKYTVIMELLSCVEHALWAPVPPYEGTDLEREYWHLMTFIRQQGLSGEFVQYRAALEKQD